MVQIQTLSELRSAWRAVIRSFGRDLTLAARLARDPVDTLAQLGYEVHGDAARALEKAAAV